MKTTLLFSGMLISAVLVNTITAKAATNTAAPLSTQQVQQIEQVVHDYLVKNPQVLVEASEALRNQMQQGQEKAASGAIRSHSKQLFSNSNSPVAGNPQGTVTLVEFFDYQCGHCKEMAGIVGTLIKQNSNLRVVFKELPIFGGASDLAAQAALAAQKQGKFYAFHEALMQASNPLDETKIMDVAKSVGLNTATLATDMKSAAIAQEIKANTQLAQDLQLMGTPAFVLANRAGTRFAFIPGASTEQNLSAHIKKLGQ